MMKWLKQTWLEKAPVAPGRAVTHPAWVLAVFVLLVNDHMLKPQAALELLAGKLSDFAGLFFFPVLLAALLGVKTRRGLWMTGAATAVVFAGINLSTGAAGLFDSLVSLLVPFATTTDPTDLLALIAIPAGLQFFGPTMRAASSSRHRFVEATAIAVGSLASMATSEPPCEFCTGIQPLGAQVSVLNKTNELHILRLRDLRAGVELDCDQVAESPNDYLPDALFGSPRSWFLQSGQEIRISENWNDWDQPNPNDNRCRAVLIQSDTVPNTLVFWDADLPFKSFNFDVEVPQQIPADNATLVLDADYSRAPASEMHSWRERSPDCREQAQNCNDDVIAPLATIPAATRYSWRSEFDGSTLHHPRTARPAGLVVDVPEQCQTPDASDGLAWEDIVSNELFVVGVEPGLDGCHEVQLERFIDEENEPFGWWVCAPYDSLSVLIPGANEQKRVAMSYVRGSATFNEGGYEGVQISVVTLENETPVGLDTITMTGGYGLPDEIDFDPKFVPIEGCEPIETLCGQVALPVDVDVTAYGEVVRPGESISVGAVQPLDIYIVRAEYRPVVDTTCEVEFDGPNAGLESEGYIETVVVRRDAGR